MSETRQTRDAHKAVRGGIKFTPRMAHTEGKLLEIRDETTARPLRERDR